MWSTVYQSSFRSWSSVFFLLQMPAILLLTPALPTRTSFSLKETEMWLGWKKSRIIQTTKRDLITSHRSWLHRVLKAAIGRWRWRWWSLSALGLHTKPSAEKGLRMMAGWGGTASLGVWLALMVAGLFGTTTRVSMWLLTPHAPAGWECIWIVPLGLCPSTEFPQTVRSASTPLQTYPVTLCIPQWHLTLSPLHYFVSQVAWFSLHTCKRVSRPI